MVKTMAKVRMAHASRLGQKERKLVITMAKLCMAHASTHGTRKTSGPKSGKGGVLIVALLGYEVYEDLPISRHYKA